MKSRKAAHEFSDVWKAIDEVRKRFKAEYRHANQYFRSFQKAIRGSDPTAILIKGHLFVENELENVLRNVLPRYETIAPENESSGWSFTRKADLLQAMALISKEEWGTLRKLNDVRNAVAHLKVKDSVPEVTAKQIHELWAALASNIRELFPAPYSQKNGYKENLRNMMVSILVTFHIRAEIQDELGIADFVRFHLTGETVMQRIQKAEAESAEDSKNLGDVKKAIAALPLRDRNTIRAWFREVYHY
jgi:hypothetical protein